MWSHSVSHKCSARLIYCTKCCTGVFLAPMSLPEDGGKGMEASWKPLSVIHGAWAPRSAMGGQEMVTSPVLCCRAFAPLFASCIFFSLAWADAHGPSRHPQKTCFSISMPPALIPPPNSLQAALEHFFLFSLAHSAFQASGGIRGSARLPKLQFRNRSNISVGARCCSTWQSAFHQLTGTR